MKTKILLGFAILCSFLLISASVLEGGYQIGDTAEDFTLRGIDQKMITLSAYAGEEGVIVIFTCNTCPYAQLYEDRIINLHKTYANQGFPVLAINPNDPEMKPGDSFEKMKVRAHDKSFPFPYLFDEDQHVFPKFGATRTPHAFVLDKTLSVRYIGAIDDNPQDAGSVQTNYIENAISAIRAGQDPDPQTTKAIGCGIKAKRS
jgi:peroxiredoxin